MSKNSHGVRNGKPSKLAKKVTALATMASMLVVMPYSAARAGENRLGEFFGNIFTYGLGSAIDEGVRNEMQKNHMRGLTPARRIDSGLSAEESAILEQYKRTPRVVCIGDVDNDGHLNWLYYDGKGNKFGAAAGFRNGEGIFSLRKKEDFTRKSFTYHNHIKDEFFPIPENTLVVYYEDSKMAQ